MGKKYQRPVARDLGDLLHASGQVRPMSCGGGLGVGVDSCANGTSFFVTDCVDGPQFDLADCDLGPTAVACAGGIAAD